MQINFHDDGNGEIRVLTLTGEREVARLVEAPDGSVVVNVDAEEAGSRGLPVRSEYADLLAAQSFLIKALDPDLDYEPSQERPAPRPVAVPVAATRRREVERTPWRGGPKRGTHYALADTISKYFHNPFSTLHTHDIRDKSPAHRQCYDLAIEAAQMFQEAQSLSRSRFPGSGQMEMSYRGKAKRALDKAKKLYDPIWKADRQEAREALPLAVRDVVGDTKDLEVALERIAAKGFSEIGEGHHATVYGRGGYDTLRAGNGVDGYYRQVVASDGPLAPFVGVHVPIVKDVLLTEDGGAVALVERLTPLPDEGEVPELDVVVSQAIAVLRGSDVDADELDGRYPRFREYAGILRSVLPSIDTRRENLMLRDGNLIVNDPSGRGFLESEMGPLRAAIDKLPFRAGPPAERWWAEAPEESMGMRS